MQRYDALHGGFFKYLENMFVGHINPHRDEIDLRGSSD